ncbi:MAG: hypothetical protein AB7F20_02600 [Geoalkalibacter sp.]|uniref:hypothetical protein n=1 Tax=Geoalkalibacter sp. TaxID=3041440 RepID=UPI003D0A5896
MRSLAVSAITRACWAGVISGRLAVSSKIFSKLFEDCFAWLIFERPGVVKYSVKSLTGLKDMAKPWKKKQVQNAKAGVSTLYRRWNPESLKNFM